MIDIFCPHCGFELTEAEIRRFVASLNGRRPKKREKLVEHAWIPGPICKCGRTKECGPAAKRCQICNGAYTLNDPATDLGYVVPAGSITEEFQTGEKVSVRYESPARPDRAHVRNLGSLLCKHQRPKHLCLACDKGRK